MIKAKPKMKVSDRELAEILDWNFKLQNALMATDKSEAIALLEGGIERVERKMEAARPRPAPA